MVSPMVAPAMAAMAWDMATAILAHMTTTIVLATMATAATEPQLVVAIRIY